MHCSTTLPPPGFCNRHVDKMSNGGTGFPYGDRKSTRLNSSHDQISYAVFCLKKKNANGHEGSQAFVRLHSDSLQNANATCSSSRMNTLAHLARQTIPLLVQVHHVDLGPLVDE